MRAIRLRRLLFSKSMIEALRIVARFMLANTLAGYAAVFCVLLVAPTPLHLPMPLLILSGPLAIGMALEVLLMSAMLHEIPMLSSIEIMAAFCYFGTFMLCLAASRSLFVSPFPPRLCDACGQEIPIRRNRCPSCDALVPNPRPREHR